MIMNVIVRVIWTLLNCRFSGPLLSYCVRWANSVVALWSCGYTLEARRPLHTSGPLWSCHFRRWVVRGVRVACPLARVPRRRCTLTWRRLDEQSRSDPQEQLRLLQTDARHLVEPVADQSEHSHRLVLLIGHSDVRVATAAGRCRETNVFIWSSGTQMQCSCAMRGPLCPRNSSRYLELNWPSSTRESLNAQVNDAYSVGTRCASHHSPPHPRRLSATSL